MAKQNIDIVIFGAGIAGLWLLNALKSKGYSVLLFEPNGIGGQQTLASQGIIHSGLKYAFAGKVNKLAKNISAMPDRWRKSLHGDGEIDLRGVEVAAESQILLVPKGLMGGLISLVTTKTLGQSVHKIPKKDWPSDIKESGFQGTAIFMGEPVLHIPSAVEKLAAPNRNFIKTCPQDCDPKAFLESNGIKAQRIIMTAAAGNKASAEKSGHDDQLETQHRPLVMGFLKPAPFPLYAHLVGQSEKPVATITTHYMKDGTMIWYLGGGVAEKEKSADPDAVRKDMIKAFSKYMPDINISALEWSTLPIDRVEGRSEAQGWMPDMPTLHKGGTTYYCWPTKLTFAPLLADRVLEELNSEDIKPKYEDRDWQKFENAELREPPWNNLKWNKDS